MIPNICPPVWIVNVIFSASISLSVIGFYLWTCSPLFFPLQLLSSNLSNKIHYWIIEFVYQIYYFVYLAPKVCISVKFIWFTNTRILYLQYEQNLVRKLLGNIYIFRFVFFKCDSDRFFLLKSLKYKWFFIN